MNLKGLIHRELAEGVTEKELASTIGVPQEMLENILVDKLPEDSASWDKFARYFRMNADVLRTGGSTHSITILNLADHALHSGGSLIRKIPLLDWDQLSQMVTSNNLPDVIHAEATLDTTDISGERTVALKVRDDSMETMFSEGEIIFVDPDSTWKPGDYVIVSRPDGHPGTILLRQVKASGSRYILHALNRKFEDLPLTKQDKVWGKVVRLTKTL